MKYLKENNLPSIILQGLQIRDFDSTMVREDGSLALDTYGVDTGVYSTHLLNWFKHFPREQVNLNFIYIQRKSANIEINAFLNLQIKLCFPSCY